MVAPAAVAEVDRAGSVAVEHHVPGMQVAVHETMGALVIGESAEFGNQPGCSLCDQAVLGLRKVHRHRPLA